MRMNRHKNDIILEESRKLFFQKGYRNVTVDEIASAMSISKKTIYKHFRSKKAILGKMIAVLFFLAIFTVAVIFYINAKAEDTTLARLYIVRDFPAMKSSMVGSPWGVLTFGLSALIPTG